MIDGRSIPCARTPIAGPRLESQMAVLGAGDMFTCAATETGIRCWGATRDGLFGQPGSCPEALKRAWPTLNGPVAAPKASCTMTPVALPGSTEFDPYLHVSPRRICYQRGGKRSCLGAVPQPSDLTIVRATESDGSDASACAIVRNEVLCWGELYSPPGEPSKPVAVALEPLPPLGDMSTVGDEGDPKAWKSKCRIHEPCPPAVSKLPACAGDVDTKPVTEILASTATFASRVVSVRGVLGVGKVAPFRDFGLMFPLAKCSPETACCKAVEAPIVIGVGLKASAGQQTLGLRGLSCSGDESRMCCDAPAFGQTVVATGRLERVPPEAGPPNTWQLADVALCE
jgi:hypothetical protein